MARKLIGVDAFREVHISTSLKSCEQRDPKGLYEKARAGLINDFTGVSAPYEIPKNPFMSLDTNELQIPDCLVQLLSMLQPFLGCEGYPSQAE